MTQPAQSYRYFFLRQVGPDDARVVGSLMLNCTTKDPVGVARAVRDDFYADCTLVALCAGESLHDITTATDDVDSADFAKEREGRDI